MTETDEPPEPRACASEDDIGAVHHNRASDTWYECVFDRRRDVITWAIIPAPDE